MPRPSLLMLTAAVAGTATIGNAVGLAAAPDITTPAQSRLGTAIDDDIGQRDKSANRRTRALDLREQAVRAAETRLKSEASSALGSAAANPSAPAAPTVPDQYDTLARIYQAMKPAAAAIVLEQLDLDVQIRVAQKMRDRSTAMIMAAMSTKGAARLTMALAGQRSSFPTVAPGKAR